MGLFPNALTTSSICSKNPPFMDRICRNRRFSIYGFSIYGSNVVIIVVNMAITNNSGYSTNNSGYSTNNSGYIWVIWWDIWSSGWWLTDPSEKYEFVSWDDDIPNIWKNKNHVPNHQPAVSMFTSGESSFLGHPKWPERRTSNVDLEVLRHPRADWSRFLGDIGDVDRGGAKTVLYG